jgi:hypothetical protein
MKWCVALLLVSIVWFGVVVVATPPVPQNIFAAMDQGRLPAPQPVEGGMRMSIVSHTGPLIMVRRPFGSFFARALLLVNTPVAIVAFILSFVLRSTRLSSALISDVLGVFFVVAVVVQWLAIGKVVSRGKRRGQHAA